ncbi:hypothetical protein EXU85_26075 [Spirosoma sp. KCTC 42546]|uniref:hypothetical protein n=1 Tax=Spirosoma sp. KCTC 42546 TaxID=2520506 RepID=UPI00115A18FB|nr:hypothetical protein [Spirosoma sp. KCTC 42546]QDK81888.1 hypothetical protein EXU85_26075 [Spirosoma sp. KCTC 42546]
MKQQYTFTRQPRHVYARLLGSLLSGLLLLLTGLNAQAQKNWVGTTTNWNTASNWSPAGIPTASDNVVIAASATKQPVLTVSALAGSVEVQSGASLSITSGGKLTLNGSRDFGSGQTTAFYTSGTVTNAGQLVIGNTSAVGRYGLINKGSFSNETGGASLSTDQPAMVCKTVLLQESYSPTQGKSSSGLTQRWES